ncbi:MAG: energy-coupling factor transporter transmembrane protein EcfT [Cellulosilyticum sp.]|nr:energy-coupling factor transporter transmembrane protein EcfT [Cellulosilyticum sp.]
MQIGMMQAAKYKESYLDPRTKILLLVMLAVFVLGGTGGRQMSLFRLIFSSVPFILLLLSGKVKTCLLWSSLLIIGGLVEYALIPRTTGILNYMMVALSGMLTRFAPSIMMGMYAVSTTTVSEFVAAMERMHITEKITIPMTVMFRFFPTVREEYASIHAAMRMRGISLAGGKIIQMVEYRLIPMMTSSVKIGEELSAAALTRGLGTPIKRTNICQIGFHIQDKIIITFCLFTIGYWILGVMGVIG